MKIPYNHHPGGMERFSLSEVSDKYVCNLELDDCKDDILKNKVYPYDTMSDLKPKYESIKCEGDMMAIHNQMNTSSFAYGAFRNEYDLERSFKLSPKREYETPHKMDYMPSLYSANERVTPPDDHRFSHKYGSHSSYEDEMSQAPFLSDRFCSKDLSMCGLPEDSKSDYQLTVLDSKDSYEHLPPSYPDYGHSQSYQPEYNAFSPYYNGHQDSQPREWCTNSIGGSFIGHSSSLDEDYPHSQHLDSDHHQPLDLTMRKHHDLVIDAEDDRDSPRLLIDDHRNSLSDGENAWLKKIRTGTRSRVRSPKSWEFLVRLLQDPQSNPSMIKWEDKESGTFRLVNKEEIARIWGTRSNKNKKGGVSYDNFARNLRYHYKTEMMVPVSEKHLVYKFGSKILERIQNGDFKND